MTESVSPTKLTHEELDRAACAYHAFVIENREMGATRDFRVFYKLEAKQMRHWANVYRACVDHFILNQTVSKDTDNGEETSK